MALKSDWVGKLKGFAFAFFRGLGGGEMVGKAMECLRLGGWATTNRIAHIGETVTNMPGGRNGTTRREPRKYA